jgi:protein SCO1
VTRRAALLVALALMAFPALMQGREASGGEQLPVIGPAPPFALTSQDSKPVSLGDMRGKVVAVTFIYTGCPDICPLLTQKMADVQDALGAVFAAKIAFVSITLDPEHDADGQIRVQYLGARFDPEEFRRDLMSLVDKE